jgi:dihydroceramidase
MTGTGAYLYIVWGIWLRHCLNQRQEEFHLWWPHIWNIPEIVRTPITANGSAKKSE